jgi:glucoamylase
MKTQFEANINIQGKGGVVASPDPSTPGGSYYYHWERDGALSMRAYAEMNDYNLDVIKTKMQAYIGWVVHIQSEYDPNGVDVRIEPKFNLPDGSPYTGGWCRPQNDAPGLRATTLIYYANAMLDSGNQDNINYVK